MGRGRRSGSGSSSDRWLSPDLFEFLLYRGKSGDKRKRFASTESIPSPPLHAAPDAAYFESVA
ncbi:hypothetical protein ABGV42_21000 [Paenibacillus pabuli]